MKTDVNSHAAIQFVSNNILYIRYYYYNTLVYNDNMIIILYVNVLKFNNKITNSYEQIMHTKRVFY